MKNTRRLLAFALGLVSAPVVILAMTLCGASVYLRTGEYVNAIKWAGKLEDKWIALLRRVRG